MGNIIGFLVIAAIWGYCAITQIPEARNRKRYYEDKAREYSMKGEKELADKYRELAVRTKTL